MKLEDPFGGMKYVRPKPPTKEELRERDVAVGEFFSSPNEGKKFLSLQGLGNAKLIETSEQE